jgi:hypothetical protein
VNSIIDGATFTGSFSAFARLGVAIVGPEKSGNSLFLGALTDAFIARFLASGQYKRTLLVALDVRELGAVLTNPLALYSEMVAFTFKHLAAQRIDV